MAQSWSIEIIQLPNGDVAFRPDLPEAVQGQPLGVNKGDNVTWNNKTNQSLTLQATTPAGLYLTDPIPAGQVSNPIFNVNLTAPATIIYSCQTPPQQQHSIVVQ